MSEKLETVIRARDEFSSAFDKYVGASKRAESQTAAASRSSVKAHSDVLGSIKGLVAGYVGLHTIVTAFRWAEHAAGVEEQRAVLDRLARQAGTTGDAVENRLVSAFDGLVSRADAVDVAVRGMNAGLDTTEMELMADAATKLADITGTEKEAFDALFSAILRGNDKALVATYQIDIDIAAAQERAGKGASEWAKKQEVLNAVLTAAEKKNAELGTGIDSNSDKMVRATANIANMKDAVSSLLVPALGEAADYVSELASQFDRLLSSEKQQASLVLIEKQEELLRVEKALADIGVKPGEDKSGRWQAAADAVAHYTRILDEAIGKERQSVIGGGGSKDKDKGKGKGAAIWEDPVPALDTLTMSMMYFGDKNAEITEKIIGGWKKMNVAGTVQFDALANTADLASISVLQNMADIQNGAENFRDELEQNAEGLQDFYQGMQSTITGTFSRVGDAITDILFNDVQDAAQMLKGMMKDLFKSVFSSVFRLIGSYIGGGIFHGGGLVLHDGGMVPTKMHSGGPRPDERDVRLQAGEFVQQKRAVAYWGRPMMEAINRMDAGALGNRTGGGSVNVTFNVSAVDSQDVERFIVGKAIPIMRREFARGRGFNVS